MDFIDVNKYKNDFGIYKIKNRINGHTYIGQTSNRFQKRYWNHKWKLKNNEHDNIYLQSEWNKFGEDNFEFSIVEVISDKSILDEREIYYISYERNNGVCLNQLDGGGGRRGFKMSDHTKKLIGEKNKIKNTGKKASEETKIKMSQTHIGKDYIWKKKTNSISEETAALIKKMLIDGVSNKEIMSKFNIDYRVINNIISNNAYKYVSVDGWDEYINSRQKQKRMTDDEIIQIRKLYQDGYTINELVSIFGFSRGIISKTARGLIHNNIA